MSVTSKRFKLTAEMIRQAVEGIDAITEMEFRSYSGRNMNGKESAAVVFSSPGDLVKLGMSLAYAVAQQAVMDDEEADAEIDDALSHLPAMYMDSMGLGQSVAYWPSVPADEA
jgi:hypothetical protein